MTLKVPSSKPKATPSKSPQPHCLSGLLAATRRGDLSKAQAQEIASRWRRDSRPQR